jgi:hypothetical protein
MATPAMTTHVHVTNVTKVIRVGESGPKFTPPGQNEATLSSRALCFRENMDVVLGSGSRKEEDLKKPQFVDEVAWTAFVTDGEKYDWVWLKRIREAGFNPLLCTETEVKGVIREYYTRSGKAYKKGTIQRAFCVIRGSFKSIGRDHSWPLRKEYKLLSEVIACSGNPVTEGMEKELVKELGTVKHRVRVVGAEGHAEHDGRHGIPVSVVVLLHIILGNLWEAIGMFKRWCNGGLKDKARIYNLINLTLAQTFSMHEGCRPGEIIDHMRHRDLQLMLHKSVYWLTLVFLKAETLEFLLEQPDAVFGHYTISSWKSKRVQERYTRKKAVIPVEQNALCLLWHYVVEMRMALTLVPEIGERIFKKTHIADRNSARAKKQLMHPLMSTLPPHHSGLPRARQKHRAVLPATRAALHLAACMAPP